MHQEITFTDCRVWLNGCFEPGKISVGGGRILDVGSFGGAKGREVSCRGLSVFPALIDNHVHFREPGAEEKEDFRSGSAAAAHGGCAMVLEVQNSPPLLSRPDLVEAKRRIILNKSLVKVGLYASAVPEILGAMREMALMTSGLKLFMAPSHADEGMDSEEAMRPFFQKAAEIDFHLIVHAEDGGIIRREGKKHAAGGAAAFSKARPPAAEIAAVERALRLAEEYGTRMHLFHITCAGAVDLISDARRRGIRVTASTCPHYLFFTDADVAERGGFLKVYPSIKGAQDRKRLFEALREGEIEIISTDHAPHRPEEKELSFERVPAGISSADCLLPLLSTLAARGDLSFEDLFRCCVANPLRIHGLHGEAALRPGRPADLVFFDPRARWTVRREDFLSKADLSPYTGMCLTGRVAATWVDGRPVYVDAEGPLQGLSLVQSGPG